MLKKFLLSISLGGLWLAISCYFAFYWTQELHGIFPDFYIWWVIIGIALLPGLLMSTMFFSNLLNWKIKNYPNVKEATTVIMCAHNEEKNIAKAIQAIIDQNYADNIRLLVIDNCSTDHTKKIIKQKMCQSTPNRQIEYVFCSRAGKHHALNAGLKLVCTPYFITVDGDTCLEKSAVQKIMDHIMSEKCACVAGNIYVANSNHSIITKMQNYDYLLSICAIKRFQGSYHSTLVAQGAFSAYETEAVCRIGGWKDVLGEDIVLTYQLLQQDLRSDYEPQAVGYTVVPESLNALYRQRKRWAIGMIEGLITVPPWKQGNGFSRYFTTVNLFIIDLDLAFLFGLIPGVIWAFFGFNYFVGCLTLWTILICTLLYFNMYQYQRKLNIPFIDSFIGFIAFLFSFQLIQSTAAIHGYITHLTHKKGEWS